MATANYGGYDYSFVDRDLDKYTCNICKKILKDPQLTGCCGQHYCESCLNYWFTTNHRRSCPHCRTERPEFQYFLNKSVKREIDSLRIHCTNKEEGCQWIGELGSLKDHLESANGCGYVEVKCPNKCEDYGFCTSKPKRKDLANHLENKCYLRPYQCVHCGWNNIYRVITTVHYASCPEFPLPCPNNCLRLQKIKRKDMKDHRSQCPEEEVKCTNGCEKVCTSSGRFKRKNLARHLNSECQLRPFQCVHCGLDDTYRVITTVHYANCPEFPLPCPNNCIRLQKIKRKDMKDHRSQCSWAPVQCLFKEAGCKQKLVRRELEQHMSANQQHHLLMVLGAYKEIKQENKEMKKELQELKQELQWR